MRTQYNTNFFSLLDCDKNKTNDIKDSFIEDNDIEDDDDSDFLPSIQSEESNDISENNKNHNTISNEISEIINQSRESENNTSLQNESTSKCLNKSTRYKLFKTKSKSSLEGENLLITRKRINYCKDADLLVEMSQGPKGDTKSNFCIYCNTMQTKIARHLELKHSNEKDVAKFLSLPKSSYERRIMIGNCRKKGNYKFNTHANVK